MGRFIKSFDQILETFSRCALVASLFVILILAVFSIVLRWMGSSPLWLEPLVRHVVFLSAFLGGSLATSKGVHIKVDVLTHLVENSKSKLLHWFHRNVVALFSLITCVFLVKSGYDFYLVEKEFGAPAFLEIHSAYLVGIIPLGMALISLRFLNRLLISVLHGESIEPNRL